MLAIRARALIDGRLSPSLDDVVALAEPVLKHVWRFPSQRVRKAKPSARSSVR